MFCNNNIQQVNFIENKNNHIKYILQDIDQLRINAQFANLVFVKRKEDFKNIFKDVCSTIPNAFWNRKKHVVELPYIVSFNERDISTRLRAIHMNKEVEEVCVKEISELKENGLIRDSKSPWSCSTFYVMNTAELERGATAIK